MVHIAKLYKVVVSTKADKTVNVLAETPEEAQAKVQLSEGEVVTSVTDEGEVLS